MDFSIKGSQRNQPLSKPAPEEKPDPPAAAATTPVRPREWDGVSGFTAAPLNPGSLVGGAVAARSAVRTRPQAKARYEVQKLFAEITAAKDAANAKLGSLNSTREALSHNIESVQAQIAEHVADRPANVKGGDGWTQRMSELQTDKGAFQSRLRSVTNEMAALERTPLNVRGLEVPSSVGPVAAVVVDNLTGQPFRGVNQGEPPATLTKVVADRLANLDAAKAHRSDPGTHAEVYALNEAVAAREARTGRPVQPSELPSFTLDTVWLSGDPGKPAGMASGSPAERCANCTQLSHGVDNLAGDSTRPYEGPNAAESLPGRWTNRNVDAAKGGARSGAAAGLLFGAVDALRDGKLDGKDLRHLATTTGLGAATGAVGGVIEESVSRAVDRVAGKAIERGASSVAGQVLRAEAAGGAAATARTLAGKLGGAGVAGAVINAGFAAVDQVGAFQRGEVSASQAIGTVTGEAAVGMGAGLAGAAAGAAIGSVIPIAGTAVGGVIGFAVGVGAGYLADKGLRGLGVDKAIGSAVTSVIDHGTNLVKDAGSAIAGAACSLTDVFGW
jgi:hypothetical protein